MKVRVPDYSALPMNLVKLLEEAKLSDENFCSEIENVIRSLTRYFSFLELVCKTKKGDKFQVIIDDSTDINKLEDEWGDNYTLEELVYEICKSIKVVDLYGAEIFKAKFQ